jgi:hypothetical protein
MADDADPARELFAAARAAIDAGTFDDHARRKLIDDVGQADPEMVGAAMQMAVSPPPPTPD